MVAAVDVIDRYGPNDEMCCQLQPKKTKETLLSVYATVLSILHLFTNKMVCFSFKSGCAIRVPKHLKGDWFIVLH